MIYSKSKIKIKIKIIFTNRIRFKTKNCCRSNNPFNNKSKLNKPLDSYNNHNNFLKVQNNQIK